jgi:hypothetical protein
MCGFSRWNVCNMCGSVDRGLGFSSSFLIRFVVHRVEFSAISWLFVLEWVQVLLILRKIGSFLDMCCCLYKIVLGVDL